MWAHLNVKSCISDFMARSASLQPYIGVGRVFLLCQLSLFFYLQITLTPDDRDCCHLQSMSMAIDKFGWVRILDLICTLPRRVQVALWALKV